MIRLVILSALATLLWSCSSAPVRIDSRALGKQVSESPDRFIIAAVENEPVAYVARAGSTPRGYDTVADYGPSSRARETMHSLEAEYGLREVSAWPIEPLHVHCAVLELPAGSDRNTVLAALAKDPRVKLTQPLQTFATRSENYNDPYVGLQRGFQQMDVAEAHPWSRGEGVKIAIIDTGADILHPDLRDSIAAAANFVDADDAQFRRDRHGTEMAGVIAAVANNREGIVGIAPSARLLIFKACWQARAGIDDARCNSFTLARALAAAFAAHAQVVNLSLAGPDDRLLGELIREGQRRGVLFVGAATDAAEAPNGLLSEVGVIEVASAESGSSAARVRVVRTRTRDPDVAPRRTLRLCQRRLDCDGTGKRRRGIDAGQGARTVGCRGLPLAARHQLGAHCRGRRRQGHRCLCGRGHVAASGFMSPRQCRAADAARARRSARSAALKLLCRRAAGARR